MAIIGCGFWARYQLPAWLELEGIEIVALYNRTISKAEELALKYNIAGCYDDAEKLFANENLDFVDIITDVDTHEYFTLMAVKYGVPVICQKPMAPSLYSANNMLAACKNAGIPFYIHENFRWQSPVRRVKEILDSGIIGKPFKARVTFCSAFPVFDNQPFLANLEQFIITDIGSHILDICRFLFGEAESLYCQTQSINPRIHGEDVANVMMKMQTGLTCFAEMSYASILEYESFPQTYILVEGEKGSLYLTRDHEIRLTTRGETAVEKINPGSYAWLDPEYALVHASIVECNRDILFDLQGLSNAETTAADNFETVRLVHAAYSSAKSNQVIDLKTF
ncbi:MAG: Gfo/Idh/MocA family protein [Chitinophagaceae bacterium]